MLLEWLLLLVVAVVWVVVVGGIAIAVFRLPAASQKAQLLAQFDADGGGIGDDDDDAGGDDTMMLDSDGAGLVQGEDDLEDFESVQPIPKPRVSVSDGCEAPVASRSRRGGSAVS